MTKSSYRKTYIPHTELKTRTSLQYHYSWNTCENDLAVPVGPAKTYESPLHKGQNLIACKNPRHKGQNQIACKKKSLSCDRLTVWIRCRSTKQTRTHFSLCMMNASTFLEWFITYELTRHHTTRITVCIYDLSQSATAYRTCDTRVYSIMDTALRSTQFCLWYEY